MAQHKHYRNKIIRTILNNLLLVCKVKNEDNIPAKFIDIDAASYFKLRIYIELKFLIYLFEFRNKNNTVVCTLCVSSDFFTLGEFYFCN